MTLSAPHIPETALYAFLSTAPFTLLAVYPFRRQLRFPRGVTAALLTVLTAGQVCLRTAAVVHSGTAIFGIPTEAFCTALSTALYAGFYFLLVRANLGKLLFTLLMLSNFAALVVMESKCLEGLVFGEAMARQSGRWTASAALLPVAAAVLIPLFLYFRRCYAPAIAQPVGKSSWRYLWLVPGTFYLLWYCFCYGSVRATLDIALDPSSAALTLLVNLGGFLTYHMVILLVDEMGKNQRLTARNHQLAIQSLQSDSLNRQIAATRRARHDLHHHFAVMDGYLTAGEYEKLHQYLRTFLDAPPEGGRTPFCANSAVSALLSYFQNLAQTYHVQYTVTADIPAKTGLPDQTLTVLLGNLLENAMDACKLVTDGPRRISATVKTTSDALFIQVENTCASRPVQDQDGSFFSTKHPGKGIGLASVQAITEQYEGLMTVESENSIFCVSLLLNTPYTQ